MSNPIVIYLSCLGLSMVMTPIVSRLALLLGAVDRPNHRKVHHKHMPTMGGLAIFGAFYVGHLVFRYPHFQFQGIFLGGLLILVAGMLDDLYGLSPKWKLLAQFLAATIVIFHGQVYFREMNLPFLGLVNPGIGGIFLAYLWIVGMTNAINLIDGLDGLASGVSSITFLTMYLMAAPMNDYFTMTYALILAGRTMGFLIYNFHPAKIFMGDTGAMFLGYVVAVMAMMGLRNATFSSFMVPVILLGVPVFDTLFAMIRRKLQGKPMTQADKGHLHHLLLKVNESQTKTVLIIYGISILLSAVAVVYNTISTTVGIVLMLLVYVVVRLITGSVLGKERDDDHVEQ